mmetsp:Transcript_32033/g.43712  ORF Transcript_32033/g.43712 Transcript_32033/m.43712 type:complete len:260 (+) Transcript_32033:2265-3044(+)
MQVEEQRLEAESFHSIGRSPEVAVLGQRLLGEAGQTHCGGSARLEVREHALGPRGGLEDLGQLVVRDDHVCGVDGGLAVVLVVREPAAPTLCPLLLGQQFDLTLHLSQQGLLKQHVGAATGLTPAGIEHHEVGAILQQKVPDLGRLLAGHGLVGQRFVSTQHPIFVNEGHVHRLSAPLRQVDARYRRIKDAARRCQQHLLHHLVRLIRGLAEGTYAKHPLEVERGLFHDGFATQAHQLPTQLLHQRRHQVLVHTPLQHV